jgi:acetyltransferase-like isoleucine patch superfamily enzyme
MVGAGAVVVTDLPDHVLALGVPALVVDSWPERGNL